MELFWVMLFCVITAIVVSGIATVVRVLRAKVAERHFNEFLVCLVLHELGEAPDASLTLGTLRRILPWHEDEIDFLIEHLAYQGFIELDGSREPPRVILREKVSDLIGTDDWRTRVGLADRARFEAALEKIKAQLLTHSGVWPVQGH